MKTTSVVVMEPGSEWPGQIGDAMSVVALSQQGATDLVRATRQKLDSLVQHKERVRVAVLACNDVAGRAGSTHRAELARLLLDAAMREIHGKLVVCASERASYALREELLVLVGELSEVARGTSTSVSLRFREDPETGLRRVA